MKTRRSIITEVVRIDNELTQLKLQRDSIRNSRTKENNELRKTIRERESELKLEQKELQREYHGIENRITRTTSVILWILSTVLFVGGIGLMIYSGYINDLYKFTEVHNISNMFHGEESWMSLDLYRTIFFTRLWGGISFVLGFFGFFGSGIYTMENC